MCLFLAYIYDSVVAAGVHFGKAHLGEVSNYLAMFALVLLCWAVKSLVHVGNHHIRYIGLDFYHKTGVGLTVSAAAVAVA